MDGGAAIVCADGTACDMNPNVGVVTYSGDLGAFSVNVTTGVTKPVYTGARMLLNSVNAQTAAAGSHTLIMMFSETGFGELAGFIGGLGGTLTPNGSTITASGYLDTTDTLFGLGTLIGSTGPLGGGAFDASFSGGSAGTAPYSMTQVLTLATTGPGTSFSVGGYDLKAGPDPSNHSEVPEPSSLSVLGGVFLLAMIAARRKLRRS